jgi:hypothetical protein
MAHGKLKNAYQFSVVVGLVFLCVGVFLFLNNNLGTIQEKFGIVIMMYSGIFLGDWFYCYNHIKSIIIEI